MVGEVLLEGLLGDGPRGQLVVVEGPEQRALGRAKQALVNEFDQGLFRGHLVGIIGRFCGLS